jgi:LysR family transcriptional regulator, hydrogen peroxide-inducible genes activator
MEVHQLRYFVAAAEAGSMTLAARQCRVAQPSLSQQVRKLEESLGATLFDRLGRGVELTEAGRALLPRARRILAEVRDAAASLRREIEAGVGPLAVGAIPTIAPFLLPAHVAAFQGLFPECELTIREDLTQRLVEAVAEGELDFAITSTPIEHELVEVEVIGEENLLVAVRSDHASAGTVSIADLRTAPTVVLHDVHCLGQQIQSFCAARRVQSRVVCRGSQLSTVLKLVGLGMGYSLIPEMCARDFTPEPRTLERSTGVPLTPIVPKAPPGAMPPPVMCRFLRIARGAPRREIALVWRRDRSRSRTAVWLAEAIAAGLASGSHSLQA